MQTGHSGEYDDPAFTVEAEVRGRTVSVDFVHHAHSRMRRRGIEVEDVIRCLRSPDNRNLEADDDRKHWARLDRDGAQYLHVIFEEETDEAGKETIVIVSTWRGRL